MSKPDENRGDDVHGVTSRAEESVMDKGVFRYDTDKTRLGAPPATPLDVEACVRLLREAADLFAERARSAEPWEAAASNLKSATMNVLALALPGMGKDSELLDTLERFGWVKAGWGLVTQFDWTRKADDGPGGWARLISPRLRDAIDARSRGPQARTKL